ncbi:MAG: hypothetical protein ACK5IJ_12340 [Mangrovibacterium sp.]
MNRLKIQLAALASVLLLLASCDKSTEGISRITNYASIVLHGDATIFSNAQNLYEDPGVTVTEGDEEIDYTVSVKGEYTGFAGPSLTSQIADYYVQTYSAVNVDGFSSSKERIIYQVETGNLTNNIAGLYTTTVNRNGAGTAGYENMKYVLISKISDKQYIMSCGIGAYYQLGRKYGLAYDAPLTFTANNIAANDFTIPNFTVGTFGGVCVMSNLSVDPANKTISYSTSWDSGYTFDVVLTQVDINTL